MKRIQSINGYTIYQSTSQRDVDNYRCEIGNYNIYISADIRTYGLTNAWAEYDDVDSLVVALNICRASNYAIAVALEDELNDSTVQDYDLVLEIERRLDDGQAVSTIRRLYNRETGRLYSSITEAINDGFDPYAEIEFDPYEGHPAMARDADGKLHVIEDECEWDEDECEWDEDDLDGDLEDVLDRAMADGDQKSERFPEPHRYLATIQWDDAGETVTNHSIMSAREIIDRVDMYDCYEEDMQLWLLTEKGPLPADWHGTWHDMSDPLRIDITLRETGEVLDSGLGTDH